jgi:hypothetical protein
MPEVFTLKFALAVRLFNVRVPCPEYVKATFAPLLVVPLS